MRDYIIQRVSADMLPDYCKVPISFNGDSIFNITAPKEGFGGFILKEKHVDSFYKDFDLMDSPMSWVKNFNVENWRFFIAFVEGEPIGAATLVMKSEKIRMLEGKNDLACLWDIRVHPDWRGKGLGSALFQRVVREAKENGCDWLKIETQNNNVSANRFYKKQGCHLTQVHLHAYYDVPGCEDEAMLIWYIYLHKND